LTQLRVWLLLWCSFTGTVYAEGSVWLMDIKGAIGAATSEYVISGIDAAHAAKEKPQLIVLRMDTPGGLDQAMRAIIQGILSSDIAIIGYVAPQGARAASAGTYLLYATHLAAMSPATTLGAATPVQIGAPRPADPSKDPQTTPQPTTAMERKIINDATAYIEGLAELRQRNRDWAAQAVRSAASLSSEQALQKNVINLMATDIQDLLRQLDGMSVLVSDVEVRLATAESEIIPFPLSWRLEFLAVLSNPNIAYMLMLLGLYGLIFEFSYPGMGVPGIVGVICILLALYAFQVLPVNYAGAALIIAGIGLMIAEVLLPSFGILGIGGILAFVIGSIILFDTPQPVFRIATPVIAALTLISTAFTFLAVAMLIKIRRKPKVSGVESFVGQCIEVETIHRHQAMVRMEGELWKTRCGEPLVIGDQVRIRSVDGLILNVDKQ